MSSTKCYENEYFCIKITKPQVKSKRRKTNKALCDKLWGAGEEKVTEQWQKWMKGSSHKSWPVEMLKTTI